MAVGVKFISFGMYITGGRSKEEPYTIHRDGTEGVYFNYSVSWHPISANRSSKRVERCCW